MSPDRRHIESMGRRRSPASRDPSGGTEQPSARFSVDPASGSSVPGNREVGHRTVTAESLRKSTQAGVSGSGSGSAKNRTRSGKRRKRSGGSESAGIGRASIAITVVLLVLAVIAGVQWEQNSVVRSVTFTGYEFTSEAELEEALPFETGIQADSVNFMALMAAVNALPYIRGSDIHMEASGQMVVEVRERTPVALLIDGSGKSYVDGEGISLPVVLGKGVDVPILYGFPVPANGDTVDSAGFREMRAFLIETQKNRFASATISEVAWNDREGVVALSHENGVKLIFGHEEYEKKLRAWEAFYADIVSTSGIESFTYVDFRYRNQIVAQKL